VAGRIRPQLTIIPSHSAALAAIDRRNIVGGLRLALARPLVLEVKKGSPTSTSLEGTRRGVLCFVPSEARTLSAQDPKSVRL
jgi:hypothetical protein